MCNIEKPMKNFNKKSTECEKCNSKRGLKRYYESKEKKSNQRKICYEKNKNNLLQKKIDRYILFQRVFYNRFQFRNQIKSIGRKLKIFPKK